MSHEKRKIAVIDCETDPFGARDENGDLLIPAPFIWGLYDGETFEHFPTAEALLERLSGERMIIYAHNGGKFDYHFMLDKIPEFTEIMLINGRLAKFPIEKNEFRDSYNILPVPLRAYAKDDFDYSKLERSVRHNYMPEIIRYLESDCVNLWNFIQEFIEEYGMNLTVAGAAMKQWKKIKKDIPKSTPEFYAKFSQFYYGGRVECFQKGIKECDFSVYDINSAYPFAMLQNHAYLTNYCTFTGKEVSPKIREQNFYSLIAVSCGALPFRGDNGLEFPNDDIPRTYHVTGWELKTGIETGTIDIVRLEKCYYFDTETNFKPYIDHFWELKATAQKGSPRYIFAKLFLNSLYGKFGANPNEYETNMIINPRHATSAVMDGWDIKGDMGGRIVVGKPLESEEQRFYNVATAASITGFVRAYLFRHLFDIQKSGGELIYCDTDSIAFCVGSMTPSEGKEIGQWTNEGAFDKFGVAGKKLYAFTGDHNEKIASKGSKLNAKEIERVAQGETIVYQNLAPTFSVKRKPAFVARKIRAT